MKKKGIFVNFYGNPRNSPWNVKIRNEILCRKSEWKQKLIGILELNRNSAIGHAGAAWQTIRKLYVVIDTNLGFPSAAGRLAVGRPASARGAACGFPDICDLTRIEAGRLEGLLDLRAN